MSLCRWRKVDLEYPFESVAYSIDYLKISDSLRANIIHRVYEGGHDLC